MKKLNLLKIGQIIAMVLMLALPVAKAAALTPIPCPQEINCSTNTINGLIYTVITWLLSISFGLAVLFLIIGGFRYIISGGNEESAEKGRNTVINAIIGIVIIILSYVIVNVVSTMVANPNGGNVAP